MIEKIIKTRRSISEYTNEHIPKDLIEEMISISSYAPSSCNTQPWFFLIFETEISKRQLNSFIEEGYKRTAGILTERKLLGGIYKSLLNFFSKYGKFDKAPIYILLFARGYGAPIFSQALKIAKEENIQKIANDSVITSAAMAMQNFLLVAHNNGLGTRVKDGIKFLMNFEDLKAQFYKEFDIPKEYELVSGIQLGYPIGAEINKVAKPRLSLDKIRKYI